MSDLLRHMTTWVTFGCLFYYFSVAILLLLKIVIVFSYVFLQL
jgi:hypothetical protein